MKPLFSKDFAVLNSGGPRLLIMKREHRIWRRCSSELGRTTATYLVLRDNDTCLCEWVDVEGARHEAVFEACMLREWTPEAAV